jgi:hypothetical protein
VKITLRACSTYMGSTSAWLDPLRAALDAAPAPVTCFFRDDDVGWRDDRLRRLLELFASLDLPLDLAVIPTALGPGMARELRELLRVANGRLGVHQHGFGHVNHEAVGQRKCEFGPGRPLAEQRRDIAAGREQLALMLGPAVEPIFTPPWNRCTDATGRCLAELGFEVLSREARAAPLRVPGLREVPVHVDWFKRRNGARLPREEVSAIAADAVARGGPVGVMLHHAEMDESELRTAGRLLSLLAEHDRTRCVRLRAV